MKNILPIFLLSLPVWLMIGLIPLVGNDYVLTALYVIIIIASFVAHREQNDLTVFIFGFLIMLVSEYFFVSTGVETFTRNSLFGLMPIWLPFLWGYGFIVIGRAIKILDK